MYNQWVRHDSPRCELPTDTGLSTHVTSPVWGAAASKNQASGGFLGVQRGTEQDEELVLDGLRRDLLVVNWRLNTESNSAIPDGKSVRLS